MRRLAPLTFTSTLTLLAGCPPGPGPTPPPGGPDPAPVPSSSTAATTSEDPLAGSVFTRDDLFEVFRAEMRGGEERERVLRRHRLIDDAGRDVPARAEAYERALQRFAERAPEEWARFLQSLPP